MGKRKCFSNPGFRVGRMYGSGWKAGSPQEVSMKSLVFGGRRVLILDEALLPCLLGFGPGRMVDGTDMTPGARKAVLFHPHIVGDGPQNRPFKGSPKSFGQ
jgi:hypothetical protein